MTFGFAIFHHPESASSSLITAITASSEKQLTRYDELNPEVFWISNVDRLQMTKAKLNGLDNLKHNSFMSVSIPQVTREYTLSKQPIEEMSLSEQRDIFDALNDVLTSITRLFPEACITKSPALFDAVRECLGDGQTKMTKIVLMIMQSQFHVSQELPCPTLSGSQRIVDLSFPRAIYNEHLLTLPLPSGDWKNVKRNNNMFESLFTANPDDVPGELEKIASKACALVCIKLIEKQDNDALKALSLNNVNASWLTIPEAYAISLRTSIKVTDAIVSASVTTGLRCLRIKEELTHYERLSQQVGLLLQEGVEAIISKVLIGDREKKFPAPEAVYLASYNRLLMNDALNAVHDRGITVTRIGLNTITVAVEERDLEDILHLGYEQGLKITDESEHVHSVGELSELAAQTEFSHA